MEEVFDLPGRGLMVLPGIPKNVTWIIKQSSQVMVRRADGSEIGGRICGVDRMIGRGQLLGTPICLGSDMSKENLPIGTEFLAEIPDLGGMVTTT